MPLHPRSGVRALAAVTAGLLFAACGGSDDVVFRDAPLIVVSIDTLRSDHLPVYGYGAVATPAIDALAREAVLFERAYTPYPLTLPAHASLLTGLDPQQHGIQDNGSVSLDAEFLTLAEVLSERGYATAAFVASRVLDRRFGLNQGFQTYDDFIGAGGESAAKAGGKMRVEGKDYVVQDGDVVHFRVSA